MYAQHAGDPQQRPDPRISPAGLHVLIHGAAHPGGQEHRLLGAVLAQARDADAVADGAALLEEPGVVIGQLWHATTLSRS
jgi:hypothetical protein